MLRFVVVENSTDVHRAADLVIHGAAYLVGNLCVTAALVLCFVIALFSLSLLLELLGRSAYELLAGRKRGAPCVI